MRETVLLLQANQEKLSRMLGSINAMFLMCFRLSKLHEAGKMSHADASMVKAWTTLRGGCRPALLAGVMNSDAHAHMQVGMDSDAVLDALCAMQRGCMCDVLETALDALYMACDYVAP